MLDGIIGGKERALRVCWMVLLAIGGKERANACY